MVWFAAAIFGGILGWILGSRPSAAGPEPTAAPTSQPSTTVPTSNPVAKGESVIYHRVEIPDCDQREGGGVIFNLAHTETPLDRTKSFASGNNLWECYQHSMVQNIQFPFVLWEQQYQRCRAFAQVPKTQWYPVVKTTAAGGGSLVRSCRKPQPTFQPLQIPDCVKQQQGVAFNGKHIEKSMNLTNVFAWTDSLLECHQQAMSQGLQQPMVLWNPRERECSLFNHTLSIVSYRSLDPKLWTSSLFRTCRIQPKPFPAFLRELNSSQLKVAVVGQSGVGKSTLINSWRAIEYEGAPGWAPVDDKGQATVEPRCYDFTASMDIKLCDLPGGGTKDFPVATYVEDMGIAFFDHVLLLTRDRWTEVDAAVLDVVRTSGVPYTIVRTRMREYLQKHLLRAQKKQSREQAELSNQASVPRLGRLLNNIASVFKPSMLEVIKQELVDVLRKETGESRIFCVDANYNPNGEYDADYNAEYASVLDDTAIQHKIACDLGKRRGLHRSQSWIQQSAAWGFAAMCTLYGY